LRPQARLLHLPCRKGTLATAKNLSSAAPFCRRERHDALSDWGLLARLLVGHEIAGAYAKLAGNIRTYGATKMIFVVIRCHVMHPCGRTSNGHPVHGKALR